MEKKYVAETNNIIALCHIIDDFEDFEERLLSVISLKYNRDFSFQLLIASKGQLKLGTKKVRDFYDENKQVIDTINKHSDIRTFINSNYDEYGSITDSCSFFSDYLLSHRGEINKIIALLEKIKELGFEKLEFNPDLVFENQVYFVNPEFERNFSVAYVENALVLFSCCDGLRYTTTDSNYKIELNIMGQKTIKLNSLSFSPQRLPQKIDKESVLEYFSLLQKKNQNGSYAIQQSVDLYEHMAILEGQLSKLEKLITRFNGERNNESLIGILLDMRTELEKLKIKSHEIDKHTLESYPMLNQGTLDNAKIICLSKLYCESNNK